MKLFGFGLTLSAHVLKPLYNDIRTICNASGEFVSNPLLVSRLNSSVTPNLNAKKFSTSAQEIPKEEGHVPSTEDMNPKPSERVYTLADDIAGLTLLEVSDLTDVLRNKFDIKEMPIMTMMMPGMGMPVMPGTGGKAGAAKVEEKQAKTFFDLKLESYDAASKIKIIKEVRTFTDLGLKEAKDLVEKTPALLKKGVTKEEGDTIIKKLKDLGAKVVME